MRKHLKGVQSRTHDIRRALGLVWRVSAFWTAAKLVLVVIQGLLPLCALYLMKKVIDTVSAGALGQDPEAMRHLVIWVALMGGVALLIALCRSLGEVVGEAQSYYVTESMTDLVHRQSVRLDLAHYQNSQFHDTIHRAQQEAPFRPLSILNSLTQISQSTVSLIGVAGLLLAFNVPLTLLLAVCAVPAAIFRLIFARRMKELDREQTKGKRLAQFYHLFLTIEQTAKELKTFDLGSSFRERYLDLKRKLRTKSAALLRQRTLVDFLSQTFATIVLFGCLGVIAASALRGEISLGDMVLYYQAFQLGMNQLQGLLRNASSLFEHSLFLEHFFQFLDLKPELVAIEPRCAAPVNSVEGIRFEDVTFHYQGREDKALDQINLAIAPGQVIALVGANGSGKSTIAKLLPRLYDPSSGKITVDGIDLRNMEPEEWRRQVSVVFQDFLKYPLSAMDNIRLGDMANNPDLYAVRAAAKGAGADDLIKGMPHGYDTFLGNAFNGGQELSGGEWQKIAVARAYVRKASLVILDEPSSALDPLAEVELFNRFRALVKGKSAVLISHRFSTVQMADYIYVLDEGCIVEQGTHQELLDTDGMYARFYFAQAEKFQDARLPRSEFV